MNGVSYATLQDAINAAPTDKIGSIMVYDDIDSLGPINIKDKQIYLNFNGHVLNGTGINVDGAKAKLIVEDGQYVAPEVEVNNEYTITNTSKGSIKLAQSIDARNGATVEWRSGVLEATEGSPAIKAHGDQTGQTSIPSTIHVYGGYIKGKEGCVGVLGQGATAEIKQVQTYPILEATDNAPVAGNGTYTNEKKYGGTSITIGKSTIIGKIESKGYVACGVYHPQSGTLTIEDGANIVAVGGAGIVMRGGTLNVKGGTITATGDKDLVGKVGNSDIPVPTSGIVYNNTKDYYDHTNVNILVTGGTITGAHSAVELIDSDGSDKGTITLTGGTYSSDVSNFLSAEYHATLDQTTGKYTLSRYEAKVTDKNGTDHYTSLADALSADNSVYTSRRTITLLTDAALNDRVECYRGADEMKLDLDGHNIEMRNNAYIDHLFYGKLTLSDSQGTGRIYNTVGTSRTTQFLFSVGGEGKSTFIMDGGTIDVTDLDYAFEIVHSKDITGYLQFTGGTVKNSKRNGNLFYLSGSDNSHVVITGGRFSESVSSYISNECIQERDPDDKSLYIVTKKAMFLTYDIKGSSEKATSSIGAIKGAFDITYEDASLGYTLAKMEVMSDIPDVSISLHRAFAKDKWEALYLPYAIKVTSEMLNDFDIAEIWDTELIDEKTTIEFIKLKAGEEIPAYTPCLVKRKGDKSYLTVEGTDVTTTVASPINCSTVKQLFTFYGVLEKTSFADMDFTTKSYYVLDAANQTLVKVDGTNSLSPLKFYMTIEDRSATQASTTQASRIAMRVIGDGGQTTGITDLAKPATKTSSKVYNLQGICVGSTTEGLPAGTYIQNGRKIIVK